MKETAYFCTSAYQLLSVLSLAQERKDQGDLYIDPQFKGAEEYAERLSLTGLFHKVRVIDSEKIYGKFYTKRQGFINHIQIAKSYMKVDEISAMVLGEDEYYRNIFISSRAYLPRMVIFHHQKHQSDTSIFQFDDGIGSYFGDDAYQPSTMDRIARKLLIGNMSSDAVCERYLFSPEIYSLVNPDSRRTIRQISRFWETDTGLKLVNKIFNTSSSFALSLQESIILQISSFFAFSKTNSIYWELLFCNNFLRFFLYSST